MKEDHDYASTSNSDPSRTPLIIVTEPNPFESTASDATVKLTSSLTTNLVLTFQARGRKREENEPESRQGGVLSQRNSIGRSHGRFNHYHAPFCLQASSLETNKRSAPMVTFVTGHPEDD